MSACGVCVCVCVCRHAVNPEEGLRAQFFVWCTRYIRMYVCTTMPACTLVCCGCGVALNCMSRTAIVKIDMRMHLPMVLFVSD